MKSILRILNKINPIVLVLCIGFNTIVVYVYLGGFNLFNLIILGILSFVYYISLVWSTNAVNKILTERTDINNFMQDILTNLVWGETEQDITCNAIEEMEKNDYYYKVNKIFDRENWDRDYEKRKQKVISLSELDTFYKLFFNQLYIGIYTSLGDNDEVLSSLELTQYNYSNELMSMKRLYKLKNGKRLLTLFITALLELGFAGFILQMGDTYQMFIDSTDGYILTVGCLLIVAFINYITNMAYQTNDIQMEKGI